MSRSGARRLALLRQLLPPLAVALAVLGLWQLGVWWAEPPAYLLPGPLAVLREASARAGELFSATLVTGLSALAGLGLSLLLGLGTALLFALSPVLQRSLYPYAIFLQTVPIVAVAPLIIIWLGTGPLAVIAITVIISIFPIIASTTAGLTSAPAGLHELFSIYRASRWQRLLRLQLPHALPQLFTGLRTAAGLSVIGAIVGEFFAGYGSTRQGLGYWITISAGQLKTAWLFACIGASTALGLGLFSAVGLLARRTVGRWHGRG